MKTNCHYQSISAQYSAVQACKEKAMPYSLIQPAFYSLSPSFPSLPFFVFYYSFKMGKHIYDISLSLPPQKNSNNFLKAKRGNQK